MAKSSSPSAAGTGSGSSPQLFIAKAANLLFTLSLTFIGLTAITFIIGRVMPADPVLAIVGDRASNEVYEAMYLKLGLDKPLIQQYYNAAILFVANDAPGALFNPDQTREAECIVETVEL